jgi:hypothetical protein
VAVNPIFQVNPRFTNISGQSLRALTYVVRTLSGDNTLINADGAPPAGGVGSTVTVPDQEMGPDRVLRPGETFIDPPFFICLASENPFAFFIDVLGIPVP